MRVSMMPMVVRIETIANAPKIILTMSSICLLLWRLGFQRLEVGEEGNSAVILENRKNGIKVGSIEIQRASARRDRDENQKTKSVGYRLDRIPRLHDKGDRNSTLETRRHGIKMILKDSLKLPSRVRCSPAYSQINNLRSRRCTRR